MDKRENKEDETQEDDDDEIDQETEEENDNPPLDDDRISRYLLVTTNLGINIVDSVIPEEGPFEKKMIPEFVPDGDIFSLKAIFDFYCESDTAMVDLEMMGEKIDYFDEMAIELLFELGKYATDHTKPHEKRKKIYVIFYLFHVFDNPLEKERRVFDEETEKRFNMQIIYVNGDYKNPLLEKQLL